MGDEAISAGRGGATRPHPGFLPVATLVVLLLAGCDATVCAPGETQVCYCPGAATSAQVCADDGRRWQPCGCEDAVLPGDDDATDPLVPEGAPAEIRMGDEVTCADPEPVGPMLSFTERSQASGIAFVPSTPEITPFEETPGVSSLDVEMGGGQAVGDLDGDGHLDLVFADSGSLPRYFRGDGALGFTEVPGDQAGFPTGDHYVQGISLADIDGDGDLDLYFLARDENLHLDNDGDGTFTDVTAESGLGGGIRRSAGASWCDFDRDGDLDAFLANHGAGVLWGGGAYPADRDSLFVQQSDGTFEDRIDDVMPYELDGYGFQGAWFDADADGWTDLYVINDLASHGLFVPNMHMRNGGPGEDGGWIWEVQEDSGLQVSMLGMGVAIGDMDNDMDFDVHVTNAGPTLLARNDLFDDGNFFTDISLTVVDLMFTDEADVSYSTTWFDHDNDGWQELETTFSYMPSKGEGYGPSSTANAMDQPDGLWLWDPVDGGYSNIASELDVADTGINHSNVVVDLDRDGFLDMIIFGMYEGPRLYASACNANSWLLVHLEMPGTGNLHAVGAEVELWSEGEPQQLRQVQAGLAGDFSGGPPEVHFGAGSLDQVDLLVRWPDGSQTVNHGVPTRREVWLTR